MRKRTQSIKFAINPDAPFDALAASPRRPLRPPPESVAETARYIAQLTAELAGLAEIARLEMLAYFLTLARTEAENAAKMALQPSELARIAKEGQR